MHLHEANETAEDDIVAFGSFQLNRTRRTLSKGGIAIGMRSRAMGILLALTQNAGAVVSNRELLRSVWPGMVVESGTVRVHVAQLRNVLRKADPGTDYVHNVTGHGYRLAVPVVRQRRPADAAVVHLFGPEVRKMSPWQSERTNNLPHLMTPIIGREQDRDKLVELVASKRFVTITGAGGIGKTTAAIVAAASLAESRSDGICFLDLTEVERAEKIWTHFGAMLGMPAAAMDPRSEILKCLARRPLLLVLDNCEHIAESATRLAESVLRACPKVKILATSREPLRASGEVVYALEPLGWPVASDRLSGGNWLDYPAIRLFVERAGIEFGQEELVLVAAICERLAGNALGIEIAASQCRWLGLQALAVGLNEETYLSIEGRRTAHPRHHTLRASLDWSYDLLSTEEQAILRHLPQLPARFSVDHAAAAIANEQLPRRLVFQCLFTLARKSLLITDTASQDAFYELHDLTRAYARAKLQEMQELSFSNACRSQLWQAANVEQMPAPVRLCQSARSDTGLVSGS